MYQPEGAKIIESARQKTVIAMLLDSFSKLFGRDLGEFDLHASFLEMGADSLLLLRASQIIQDKFGAKIPFRLLLDEVPTIESLSEYICLQLPPEFQLQSAAATAEQEASTPAASNGSASAAPAIELQNMPPLPIQDPAPPHGTFRYEFPQDVNPSYSRTLERVLAQQMQLLSEQIAQQTQIMSRQLDLLRGAQTSPEAESPSPSVAGRQGGGTTGSTIQPHRFEARPASVAPAIGATPGAGAKSGREANGGQFEPESFVAYKAINKSVRNELTPRQQKHLETLTARVIERTQQSKQYAQTYRPYMADSRTTAGFRWLWKEMTYPLVVRRAAGARIWDIDGNEYVDLTMGFGALLFGHSPPFIIKALQSAIADGIQLGTQSPLAGQAAKLICELTGVERVTFCNSGTEAVMSALRIARTVTGRDKVAMFEGSYHGAFDGVMVKKGEEEGSAGIRPIPLAPGIPRHMIENVLLLDYDSHESLDILKSHAHELAAVLIEPPRSRRPDVQPIAFIQELRRITKEAGAALIFDEVVTGFRFHAGGVQALFGVQADLVAYGKAFGGGLPVAAVAGKAAFMDAVDGGMWSYGDSSFPRAETTFVAGTYFKHPLIMAGVWAALNYLNNNKTTLYEDLNERTSRLATALNDYFQQDQVPMRVAHLGSLFRFLYSSQLKYMELFYYHLLAEGIYICETRNCFLSTAHTDVDVEWVIRAVKRAVAEMRAGGFLPSPSAEPPDGGTKQDYQIKDPFAGMADSYRVTQRQPSSKRYEDNASPPDSVRLTLTEAQKQLWFLTWMGEGASVAYNLSMTLRMRGPLHLDHLREAFQAIVDRHEALRISFSSDGEYQHIHAHWPIDTPLVDFSGIPAHERESQLDRWLAQEARTPFDLVNGPLARPRIVRVEEDCHLFVLTTHHIVTDGVSFGTLLRELCVRYSALCQGVDCILPEVQQFSDFVRWEIAEREGPGMRMAETYWLGQFAVPAPVLDLPTDYPRPAIQTYQGARESMIIDRALRSRLERLSVEQGSTLFMTLLAAFNLLIHKLSGQDDIVIGIPATGQFVTRGALIGYCLNVLSARSQTRSHDSFTDYLKSVKRRLLDAYEHQVYPFKSLISKLDIKRDPSRSPLVAVMFNLDRMAGEPELFGLEVELVTNNTGSAQFELDVNMIEAGDRLRLDCDYNTSLFEPQTIQRWLSQFRTLLEKISANPSEELSSVSLLSEREMNCLLLEWNDTLAHFPEGQRVHQIFESQVAARPHALAVSCGDQMVSYLELNRRANRLARLLIRRGVGPDVVVALLLDRGIDFLVSMMAIFKAGGAYLPLDPNHPAGRIGQILQQSGSHLVITSIEFAPFLSEAIEMLSAEAQPAVEIVSRLMAEEERDENLPSSCSPDNLAYLFFTSGSTGVPKGVMIQHRGMLNHLFAKLLDLGLTENDVVAETASQCFDISVWQFLSALLVGGRVRILGDDIAFDSTRLVEEIERAEITVLETVPSLLRAIVENETLHRLDTIIWPSLRWILVTGEAVPPEVCLRWLERFPQIPLLNAYGPTECSDDVTHFVVREKDSANRGKIPIGRPVANTRLYILDSNLCPQPIGVAGELCVGGIGVGRGYLGRPDLTADKFIPDPFSQSPGRLYRTGDLARYLADGNIEFLGRLDHQVKIRGFRIELGEIESALITHSHVRQAVVMAREDVAGDKRLVAYIVAGHRDSPGITELRHVVRQTLPEYMTPSAFVYLESLPVTPTGKLDRRALPAPEQTRPELERAYLAPQTKAEAKLAEIWKEALRLEQVGINDNFFELGGDSILSIQIITKANQAGLKLTPSQIFQYQTIAELASAAGASSGDEPGRAASASAVSVAPFSLVGADREDLQLLMAAYPEAEDLYPLSSTQLGMLFHYLYDPRSKAYFEQLSWALHGRLDHSAFERAWQELCDSHPVLRTTFIWEGSAEPLQVVSRRVPIKIEKLDWRLDSQAAHTTRLETLLKTDLDRGFNLSIGPLLRITLIRLSEDVHRVVLSYHHILMDGWSLTLLLREVFTLYEEFLSGRRSERPVPRPYRDYLAWLRAQDLSGAEAFWRKSLENFTAPTPLGIDCAPATPLGADEFGERQIHLSSTLTDRIQAVARGHQLTMSTIVQGVWALLLSQYSRQQDIVFGTVVSGRPPALDGVESMIGLFINTLPSRAQVAPEAGLIPWLKQLQSQQAEAREYEYSPLAQVQTWSEVPRGVPLFRSILAFENYPVNVSITERRGGLESRDIQVIERVNYPLFIVAGPGRQLLLSINYDTHLFDEAAIIRMLGHLQSLFDELASNPDRRLAEVLILTAAERHQLLTAWNETDTRFLSESCIHELIEARAEQQPDAVTVVFENEQLTYGELNRRANQLARCLKGLGVGPDEVIGVCVERSVEMMVGLLSILKAGGAYLPLDPKYPQDRLAFMVADAGVRVVLSQQHLRSLIESPATEIICLDRDWDAIAAREPGNLPKQANSRNLAYVIYTSGSTGKPKGVMVTHCNVSNFLTAMDLRVEPDPASVWLAITSISFDISVLELFWTLTRGIQVVILSDNDGTLHSSEQTAGTIDGSSAEYSLAAQVSRFNVSNLQCTPSIARMLLLQADSLGSLGLLRKLLVGGEALAAGLAEQLLGVMSGTVLNMYGPTETTIWSTAHEVQEVGAAVPIGRPIANTRCYLLDERLEPVALGVTGELFIGGAGVVRGYLNRPDITAERFLANPFGNDSGTRLYKTGDLARYLPDGTIEFLGRTDHQVKIRGFRVELGEIESRLEEHIDVSEAVVVADETIPGNKRLVGYIVVAASKTISIRALRDFVREKLPDYMTPSALIVLERMPRTPNGKIDRKALSAAEPVKVDPEQEFLAPRTQVEKVLAEIWAELLQVDRVGINDSFFGLGGDSILSIQFIVKAKKSGLQLTAAQLFERQTIAGLAEVVKVLPGTVGGEQRAATGELPLTPIQEWFFEQRLADRHRFNQARFIEIERGVDAEKMEEVVGQLLQRHDALRLRFTEEAGEWRATIIDSNEIAPFSAIDLSGRSEAEQAAAIETAVEEAQAGLNLTNGPLMRVLSLDLGENRPYLLFIVIHHIAIDILSWQILLEDIQIACRQLSRAEAIALPARTASIKQWSFKLKEYAQSAELREQLPYWLERLGKEIRPMPVDFEHGSNLEESAATVISRLSEEETQDLMQNVVKANRMLLSEVILAALVQTFYDWTGEESLLIDIEGHGREEIFEDLSLARTVGWFTSIYPVRLEMRTNEGAVETLKRIKEQFRSVPQGGIGWGLLKYLGKDQGRIRQMAATARPQIVFNYLGQQSPEAAAGRSVGKGISPQSERPYLLMINGQIAQGRLTIDWSYSASVHRPETIILLASGHTQRLRAILKQCLFAETHFYTPSDFPHASLNQDDLDRLIASIG